MSNQPAIVITLTLNASTAYQLRLTPAHYQQQFRHFLHHHRIPPTDAFYYKNIIQAKVMTFAKQHRPQQPNSRPHHLNTLIDTSHQGQQQIQSPKFKGYGVDQALSKLSPQETSDRQQMDRKQLQRVGSSLNLRTAFDDERVEQSCQSNMRTGSKEQAYSFKKNGGQKDEQQEHKATRQQILGSGQQKQKQKQLAKQLQFANYYNANYRLANQTEWSPTELGPNQEELQQMPVPPPKSQKATASSYAAGTGGSKQQPKASENKQKGILQQRQCAQQNDFISMQSTPCHFTQKQQPPPNHHRLTGYKQLKQPSKSPSSPSFRVFERLHASPTESFKNKKNKEFNPKQQEQYHQVELYLMNANLRRVSPTLFTNLNRHHTQCFKNKCKPERGAQYYAKEEILVGKHAQKKSIQKCFKGSLWQSGCRCEMKERLQQIKHQQQAAKKRQLEIRARVKGKSAQKELLKSLHRSRSCQKCNPRPQKDGRVAKRRRRPSARGGESAGNARPYLSHLLQQCLLQCSKQ